MTFSDRRITSVNIIFPKGTETGNFLAPYLASLERFFGNPSLQPSLKSPFVHFYVGVSGGADSVFLSLLLHRFLGQETPLTLLHFNHRNRGEENEKDIQFLEAFSRHLGRPLRIGVLTSGRSSARSSEEFLRNARHAFFRSVLSEEPGSIVCLAHQMDDQVETILMNLFRGTGMKGLLGMRNRPDDRLLRPILELSGSDIRQVLDRQGIPYLEDPTNQSLAYLRNRVRLELVPKIRTIFPPEGDRHLLGLSDIVDRELSDRRAGNWLSGTLLAQSPSRIIFSLSRYQKLTPYRQSLFLRAILERIRQGGCPVPEERNLLKSLARVPVYQGPMGHGWLLGIEFHEVHLVYMSNSDDQKTGNWSITPDRETLREVSQGIRRAFIMELPGENRMRFSHVDGTRDLNPWEMGTRPSRSCVLPDNIALESELVIAGPRFPAVREAFRREGVSLSHILSRRHFPGSFRAVLPVLMIGEDPVWAPGILPLKNPDFPVRENFTGLSITFHDAKGDLWKRSSGNP